MSTTTTATTYVRSEEVNDELFDQVLEAFEALRADLSDFLDEDELQVRATLENAAIIFSQETNELTKKLSYRDSFTAMKELRSSCDLNQIEVDVVVHDDDNDDDDDDDDEEEHVIPSASHNNLQRMHEDQFEFDDESFYTVESDMSALRNNINGNNHGGSSHSLNHRNRDMSFLKSLVEDEWVGDEDSGFIHISISIDEFLKIEDEFTVRVAYEKDLRSNLRTWLKDSPHFAALKANGNEDLENLSHHNLIAAEAIVDRLNNSSSVATAVSSEGKQQQQQQEHVDGSVSSKDADNNNNNHQHQSRSAKLKAVTSNPYASVGYFDKDELKAAFAEMKLEMGVAENEPAAVVVAPVVKDSQSEARRKEIMGEATRFVGADGKQLGAFNLKVIFEPNKTGFEESKHFNTNKGVVVAGRYEISDTLGQAAFSTALQCIDLIAEPTEPQWVCLKVIKNNKDFFDQSLDEIKLLQYINASGDPDKMHVLRLIDFFYYKEHLFLVSELLRENLYDFGRYVTEEGIDHYYTIPRLKKIMKQILEALAFIHSLNLIHCDVKPENIVIKSYSRCEVKLIDFGSSCFTTDNLTTYIQSRSYRAPEVIIGHAYDGRIDVWSMGAVLCELFTGNVLFQNDSVAMMLCRITSILGCFPHDVLLRGKETYKYFTSTDVVYEKVDDMTVSLLYPKKSSIGARLHYNWDNMSEDDVLFIDFVKTLLWLDPMERVTAQQALQHPWLANVDQLEIPPANLTRKNN